MGCPYGVGMEYEYGVWSIEYGAWHKVIGITRRSGQGDGKS